MTIAVVIPTYNAATFIGRTLDSVLTQTVMPDELIVVDDASRDDTCQIVLEKFAATKCMSRLIRQEKNSGGPGQPMNRGIEVAKCDWIVTLDHDDELLPDRIERLKTFIPNAGDCGIVIGRMIVRIESQDRGHLLDKAWNNMKSMRDAAGKIDRAAAYEALAHFGCYAMSCSAMAFPKSTWQAVGGFDETLTACIDFALLEAALRTKPLGVIDAPVAYWTWNERNLSHDVHRRVFDVSTVMERIHERLPNTNEELCGKMRSEMLARTYLLTSRGQYRNAMRLFADTAKLYGLRPASFVIAVKSIVKMSLRSLGAK
jgi:glycosyltransferase involved in cell wall biosynthesis